MHFDYLSGFLRLGPRLHWREKLRYLEKLGAESVLVFGSARNDQHILKAARIGAVVLGQEGAAVESILAADLVLPDIINAMTLLTKPRRLLSSLRK